MTSFLKKYHFETLMAGIFFLVFSILFFSISVYAAMALSFTGVFLQFLAIYGLVKSLDRGRGRYRN